MVLVQPFTILSSNSKVGLWAWSLLKILFIIIILSFSLSGRRWLSSERVWKKKWLRKLERVDSGTGEVEKHKNSFLLFWLLSLFDTHTILSIPRLLALYTYVYALLTAASVLCCSIVVVEVVLGLPGFICWIEWLVKMLRLQVLIRFYGAKKGVCHEKPDGCNVCVCSACIIF